MLVNGFGDIYHETGIQNSKTALPEKPFQAEKNIPRQEKVLGIGFLNAPVGNISYGMRAEYAEDSTPDNPVIKVTIQKIGSEEVHFINVNDVNVRSASEVEMFALCCYADDTGQGTGGKFGTWQTLNYYRTNASDHGGFQLTKSVDLCLSVKQDWLSMVEQMRKLYFESGLYKQALDGDSLLGFLSGHDLETAPLKDSLNLYSSKMQKLKLKELDVLEKFKEELSGYMDV